MKVIKVAALAGSAAVALGIGLGACSSAPSSSAPAGPSTHAAATHAVAASEPVVLRFSGSGTWNSPPFKVGSKVIVKYRYSDNTSGFGGDNFVADVESPGDVQSIANEIAVSGGKTTTLYPDTSFGGSNMYHLSVTATGPWYFKIVTGLNGSSQTIQAANQAAPAATSAAPVAAQPAAPAPAVTSNSQYVNAILAAGIVAPAGWITATGNTLCQDWNTDGVPVATTDRTVLEAGGILPQHVATFDAITAADVC
jgi:hypothetical protein